MGSDEASASTTHGPRDQKPVDPVSDGRWMLPFVWILFTPIATVPATLVLTNSIVSEQHSPCQVIPGFFSAVAICPKWAILLTLAPGLLNLVPIVFLVSRDRWTRLAATVATALGGLRLLVPVIAVVAMSSTIDLSVGPLGTSD